jgi:hypothetical protein
MASTSTVYDHARYAFMNKKIDVAADTFKVLLVTSTYTPDFTNHKYLSDITNEVSGNGYGRQTVSGVSLTEGVGKTTFKSSPVVFTASGGSIVARRAILFHDTGVAGTSELLCAILMDSTPADVTATSGGSITITPDSTNGWLYD